MAIKLTIDSFLAGVRQSGLVEESRLDEALRALPRSVALENAQAAADALIAARLITRWQAGKLLQGKFKGFVLGRYRLLELLGKGEMSSVYLAEHIRMKRRCAIKVLPANKVRNTSYLGRFHREAEAVAALDHPNIVRAYDVDQETEAGVDIHYLAMEYVPGLDLEQRLAKQERFPLTEATEYIRQAAEGLAHAHEHGLVHRDIKPGNLLIDERGTVKLLDLGLARFFRADDEESLTIKHDEKVLGTADYLAPEQAVDSHAVDERADIYSLGCTFYFALTGQPPFTDGTLVQRLLAHQTKAPPPVSRLRPDVPDSLSAILVKMLAKRREDRFQTARDVADALAGWLVANGDDAWRRGHPAVVAAVVGLDGMTISAQAAPAAAAKPLAAERGSRRDSRERAVSGTRSPAPPAAPPIKRPIAAKAGSHRAEPTASAAGPSLATVLPRVAEQVPARPAGQPAPAATPAPRPAASGTSPGSRGARWRMRLYWLMTKPGLLTAALVVVALGLITGVGASLYARATAEPPPAGEVISPLERIPRPPLGG
jgi:serine/threonine-protein kinase